jgi:hypothetical protein
MIPQLTAWEQKNTGLRAFTIVQHQVVTNTSWSVGWWVNSLALPSNHNYCLANLYLSPYTILLHAAMCRLVSMLFSQRDLPNLILIKQKGKPPIVPFVHTLPTTLFWASSSPHLLNLKKKSFKTGRGPQSPLHCPTVPPTLWPVPATPDEPC